MSIHTQARDAPVRQVRLDRSHALSRQILELIGSRGLKPGDRLPTTRELALIFQVATPTIREALRLLQATDAVDIRHGSGIYAKQTEQRLMIANPHYGDLDGDAVMQLLDARLLIEPYLAEKAAEVASDEDFARMEELLDEAEKLLNGHDAMLHPVNMRFHKQIARASGNQVLAQVFASLVDLYSQEQFGILELFNARGRDYREHVLIFGAIRDRDSAKAQRRMHEHLTDVRTIVEERLLNRAE